MNNKNFDSKVPTSKKTEKALSEILDEAQNTTFNLLKDEYKIPLMQIVKIRKVFMDFGASVADSRKISKEGKYFKNANIPSHLFTSEKEAIFAEAILNYLPPTVSKEKAISMVGMINSLFNIDSEWKF